MTAFELCGIYDDQLFRLKGGRVIWEAISYIEKCDKCFISRVVEKGGKPWVLGLRQMNKYISPDTIVEIVT